MSDGKTHLFANTALSAVSYAGLVQFSQITHQPLPPDLTAAIMTGFLIGSVFITPDLDLRGTRTVVLRAWGPLWILWYPVLLFSRHRGRSHTYLRGPLFRLGYLLILLLAALYLLGPTLSARQQHIILSHLITYTPAALPGYFATQWLHLRMDRIPLTCERL